MRTYYSARAFFTGRIALLMLLGSLWFVLAFFSGYLQGQVDASRGDRRALDLVLGVTTRLGLPADRGGPATFAGPDQAQYRVFSEAWRIVQREYYDPGALDPQKMTYGAIRGMIETLGDSHTLFSTPPEKQVQDSSLRGSFDG